MKETLFVIWFFLPAGFANMSPLLSPKIPILNMLFLPIDAKKKFRGQRLLGDNKTWSGLIIGIITATLVIALQKYAYSHFGWAQNISGSINYHLSVVWWLGPLLGGGALIGDITESFFKRQFKVSPGKKWIPFDQIDYVIGGILLSLFIIRLRIIDYLIVVIVWFLIHIVSTYIGYLLKIRQDPI